MTPPALVVIARGEGWIAIDKPAGEVVIPARNDAPEACLRRRAEAELGARLWVVHRIDRDTSGVVLFATDAEAHRLLSMSFERGDVSKTYLALTRGVPKGDQGKIETALHAARKGKMRPAKYHEPGAQAAVTEWKLLARWETAIGPVGLIEARPRTGRQHQIRVHMRSVEAPLLVDALYGRAERVTLAELGLDGDEPLVERLTLHARRVEFQQPRGDRTTVEAELAADLKRAIEKLGRPVFQRGAASR